MIKNRAIALGVVAGIAILGGVILSIVMMKLVENGTEGLTFKTKEKSTSINFLDNFNIPLQKNYSRPQAYKVPSNNDEDNKSLLGYPFWGIGLCFIVPGVLGLIAAFVQNRCLYVTSSIFSILCLIIVGILAAVIVLLIFVTLLAFGVALEDCRDNKDGCECRTGADSTITLFKTCAYRSTIMALSTVFVIVIVLTWIDLGAQFILCCYYGCCAKSGTTGGVILVQAQQPMLAPDQNQPQAHYPPPGYVDPNQPPGQYPPPGYVYPPPQQYYDESAQTKA